MPEVDLAYSLDERNSLVEAWLESQLRGAPPVACDIHAADEMFRFLLAENHGNRDLAIVDYLRTGCVAADVLLQILAGVFRPAEGRRPRVLDFASGFGRVTRFLARSVPRSRLRVAEISRRAVAFQRERLEIEGFESAHKPENLVTEDSFDAIFVCSLFTHLPASTFSDWLRALSKVLTPGGVLGFTVHGAETLAAGKAMPASGLRFEAVSEIDTLDTGEYGTSWVSEGFVRAAIEQVWGGSARVRRYPRGLWHVQDLYVVSSAGGSGGTALEDLSLDPGPRGQLYTAELFGARGLTMTGWAADPARPGEPVEVLVERNGVPWGSRELTEKRPDVAANLGSDAFLQSGWIFRDEVPASALDPRDVILVKARSRRGMEWVMEVATVSELRCRGELARVRAERDVARQVAPSAAETEEGRPAAGLRGLGRKWIRR